jgi:hypothetical protein
MLRSNAAGMKLLLSRRARRCRVSDRDHDMSGPAYGIVAMPRGHAPDARVAVSASAQATHCPCCPKTQSVRISRDFRR